MKKSEKKPADIKKAEKMVDEIMDAISPDRKKCFGNEVRDAVKGMNKQKSSLKPGTVDGSELIHESITVGLGNGKAAADAKKCLERSALKVNKAFEKKIASGCCSVLGFKEEKVIGTDPDKPDSVSVCGTMYRANIQVGIEKWRDCISAFTMFMDELERLAKRDAFVTSLKYEGNANWDVVFRVGSCKPVQSTSQKRQKYISKDKKARKA